MTRHVRTPRPIRVGDVMLTSEEIATLRRRPTFGDLAAQRRRRVPVVTLSAHLLAILQRELPAAHNAAVGEYRFHPIRQWRFDIAWPALRVAAECDGGIYSGGRHVQGAAVESDAEKVSVAAAMGWRVLRLTRKMIDDGRAVELIGRALAYRGQEGEP